MANVHQDFILRRIKYTKKGNRQFHDTQVGSQMTAIMGNSPKDFFSDLFGKNIELFSVQFFQILRRMNLFQ